MKLFFVFQIISADLIGFNRLGNNAYNKYLLSPYFTGEDAHYDMAILQFLAQNSNRNFRAIFQIKKSAQKLLH